MAYLPTRPSSSSQPSQAHPTTRVRRTRLPAQVLVLVPVRVAWLPYSAARRVVPEERELQVAWLPCSVARQVVLEALPVRPLGAREPPRVPALARVLARELAREPPEPERLLEERVPVLPREPAPMRVPERPLEELVVPRELVPVRGLAPVRELALVRVLVPVPLKVVPLRPARPLLKWAFM